MVLYLLSLSKILIMKTFYISIVLLLFSLSLFSQENKEETVAIVPVSEQGTNLELAAVLNLFKDSKDLEDFENKLNDKEIGVSNLDLNNDSIIDYLRVVETSEGDYRVIIIQAVLGENQFQDVATINAEKVSEKEVKVQVQGDEEIYGDNYYVEPEPEVYVNVYVWPIWGVMYAPTYVYYSSPYYWHYYPSYWHPYRPVPYTTYSSRTVVVTNRGVYVHTSRAVVVRPPVYRRTHSSVVVVRSNPHHHGYHGNSHHNNPNNNNGRNDYNRTNNSSNNNSNTRNNNSSNSRDNNSGTRTNNSTQQNRGSSTQSRSNSSTQQNRGSSTQQRSSGSTQQNRGSSTQQRSSGSTNQRSSGGRSGGGRSGGRR